MGRIAVVPGQVAGVGVSIERGAGDLDAVRVAVGRLAEVEEPIATSRALSGLAQRWGSALERLREDVEMLGRGAEAASTLYMQTDERAMGPG